MIIRPLSDWEETYISSKDNQTFWQEMDIFLNETQEQMEYDYDNYGEY